MQKPVITGFLLSGECMRLLSLMICLLLVQTSYAENDYDRWLKRTQRDFKNYVEASDRDFADYLKANWQAIGMEPPQLRDQTPKPRNLPEAPKQEEAADLDTPPVQLAPLPAPGKPVASSSSDDDFINDSSNDSSNGPMVSFDFFGHKLNIACPSLYSDGYRGTPTANGIADYWEKLSEVDYKPLLAQINSEAKRLRLNDWGKILLIQHLASSINRDNNSQALLSWYLSVRAGFDARVAFNQNIYLLLPSSRPLYGITFFTLNKRPYYALGYAADGRYDPPRGKVFTYDCQHESGQQTLNFDTPSAFAAAGNPERHNLVFSFNNQQYDLHLNLLRNTAAYYQLYPQLDLDYYLQAGMPDNISRELLSQLKPLLQGKTEQQAVNLLLRFTQTAFEYETDRQQFGYENYLFPAETLFYRYSDCEDRAILFAWLTRHLLNLDVALVTWPGHVAAAVAFHGDVAGAAWSIGDKRYVVADPTYINANAGLVMPEFAGIKPELHTL
jgi:hypothetical protein